MQITVPQFARRALLTVQCIRCDISVACSKKVVELGKEVLLARAKALSRKGRVKIVAFESAEGLAEELRKALA